jgi:hypothetical protein
LEKSTIGRLAFASLPVRSPIMEKTAIFIVLAGSRWPVVASRMSDWGQLIN